MWHEHPSACPYISDRPSSAGAAGVREADGEQAAVLGIGNVHKLLLTVVGRRGGLGGGEADAHASVSSRQRK